MGGFAITALRAWAQLAACAGHLLTAAPAPLSPWRGSAHSSCCQGPSPARGWASPDGSHRHSLAGSAPSVDQDRQDVEGGTGDVGWRHSAEGSEEGGETSGRRERKGQKSLRKRGHDRPGKETLKSGKVGKRWGGAQPRSGQCGSSSHLFRTGDIFPFCLSKFPSSNS